MRAAVVAALSRARGNREVKVTLWVVVVVFFLVFFNIKFLNFICCPSLSIGIRARETGAGDVTCTDHK